MLNVRPVRIVPTLLAAVVVTACSVYTPSLLESSAQTASDDDDDTDPDDKEPPMGSSTASSNGSSSGAPTTSGPASSSGTSPAEPLPTSSAAPTQPVGTEPVSSDGMPPTSTAPAVPPTQPGTTTPPPADTTVPTTEPPEPVPTEEEPEEEVPSDDPLIDDFEDSNTELRRAGSREGSWFSSGKENDGQITKITDAFVELPGTGENEGAMHVVASNFTSEGPWAVFGANFNGRDPAPPYVQAAEYDGVHFWVCSGIGKSTVAVEITTTDSSLSHDGEDNHYRKEIELTSTWEEVVIPWEALVQEDWADTTDFNVENVLGIQFNLAAGEEGFDVWLDDLEFIDPETRVTAPRSGECPQVAPPEPPPMVDGGTG